MLKRLDTQLNELVNKNSIKLLSQWIIKRYPKTLETMGINSPISLPSLVKSDMYVDLGSLLVAAHLHITKQMKINAEYPGPNGIRQWILMNLCTFPIIIYTIITLSADEIFN